MTENILRDCQKIYIPIIERDFHRKMSSQSSQRGRGVSSNLSPSAMPSSMMRPMKAVKTFTLKGSPTRKSPVCSPTPNAIGHRNSPERKSPISPSFKGEKINRHADVQRPEHWHSAQFCIYTLACTCIQFIFLTSLLNKTCILSTGLSLFSNSLF